MGNFYHVLSALCILCIVLIEGEFIEMSQYHRMPKLWQMDDYDECLQSSGPNEPAGVYCTSAVVLKPDNRSELWRLIEVYKRRSVKQTLSYINPVCIFSVGILQRL
ncbi:uncharacterized protein LOC125769002 isoform X1 [Anopheles funestus]|uniref:uncharacterized protein LOC125769002 isoform X1 n=1 Tax=Anopheles funestus TaxID=62324 RepID=UPI0020C6F698|nr:uncharacterized protein LOC125769002 isoform X1 [Anopheles funestus]